MPLKRDVNIVGKDSFSIDSFGRWRVANPLTIFDSKQIFDNAPLFWDDAEESGGSTGSTYNADGSLTTLDVTDTTAGKRTRQTFMRFNYQSGKSQEIFMTGILDGSGGGTGITQALGYFDDNNGLFFLNDEGTKKVVVRTKTSGSVVDNKTSQVDWNLDSLDGEGPSLVTIDWTKTQIFVMDFEWLGVGRVRFGLVHKGIILYFHETDNGNVITFPYMQTPNLPLRYQIENDGTGGAATIVHMCATVISEGGAEDNGILRYKSTEGVHVDANDADTVYALVGVRLKSTHLDASIKLTDFSVLAETNDDFEWLLYWNPTVAGTFTFGNETDSSIQSAIGATANTITNGTVMDGGFSAATKDGGLAGGSLKNALLLGAKIDGTPDEIVLCVRPLSASANIQGSLSWREL